MSAGESTLPDNLARLWYKPAETMDTRIEPLTKSGRLLLVVLPFPSWPEESRPQAKMTPVVSAR